LLFFGNAGAITLGQEDQFEDGSLDGWTNGPAAAGPTNGGGFLEVNSDGAGAGGRMAVLNQQQWSGDYNAAGVTAVSLDAANPGDTTLRVRIVVRDAGLGNAGGTAYVSATPLVLNPGAGFTSHRFEFSDLVLASDSAGNMPLQTILGNVVQFRVISATGTTFRGSSLVGTLRLDNIQAEAEGIVGGDDAVAVLPLEDVGGSAELEAVVVTDELGTGRATIKDLGSAAGINVVDYSAGLPPKDAAIAADLNGNGADDIALLLDDDLANLPRIEVRDPLSGARVKNVNFNKDHEGIALAIIDDQNNNQSQEAVVLARQGGNRPRLLIRDIETKAKVNNISLPKSFEALDLVMTGDIDGSGSPEALVLAERKSDNKGFVLIWDTGGAGKVVNVQLPKEHTPLAHDALSGPGGLPSVAVLALRQADERGRLFVYDTMTAAKLWAATVGSTRTPVDVKVYQTSTQRTRVAVLAERISDKRPIVTIYEGDTGALVTNISYNADQTPVSLVVVPDLNNNAEPELGVLVKDQGLKLRVRDSATKGLVQAITVP
jgi:hypothetical protein